MEPCLPDDEHPKKTKSNAAEVPFAGVQYTEDEIRVEDSQHHPSFVETKDQPDEAGGLLLQGLTKRDEDTIDVVRQAQPKPCPEKPKLGRTAAAADPTVRKMRAPTLSMTTQAPLKAGKVASTTRPAKKSAKASEDATPPPPIPCTKPHPANETEPSFGEPC